MSMHYRPSTARAALLAGGLSLTVALGACSSSSGSSAGSSSAGAGSSAGTTTGGSSTATGGKQIRLGMENLFAGVPFVAEAEAGAQAGARELGVVVNASAPPTLDPPTAISQVNNFLSSGVAGIAIGDEPAALWTRALGQAVSKTKGNVVAFNSVPASGTAVKTYVGINAAAYGHQLAADTIKAAGLGPDTTGEVVLGVCNVQSDPLKITVTAMGQTAKQLLPKATVLNPFVSQNVPAQNFTAWEQEMRAHPKAVLALGSCDQDGDSMIKAKQVTGGKFAIGGTATTPSVLAGLADGAVAAILTQNWYVVGYTTTRLLAEAARKGTTPVPGWINPGTTLVTKSNVAALKSRDASAAGQTAFYKPIIAKLWANLAAATKPLSAAHAD